MSPTTIYTDGACLGNPGPGGWAWAIPDGAFASGFDPQTTNQRMEVQAVLEAVRANEGPVHIVSDSTYVVKCFNDSWYVGWQKRGWKNASKQPVANQDLWRPLIDIYLDRPGDLTFQWVKGHSGDANNDRVDELATSAARNGRGASDLVITPTDQIASVTDDEIARTTPTPASASAGSGARRGIEGWTLLVRGPKPADLGGYDPTNPVARETVRRLVEVFTALADEHADLVVLTGLGLGADQLAAEAAMVAGIPFIGVVAHPNPDAVWPTAGRQRFAELSAAAQRVIVHSPATPTTKQLAGRALGKRDEWLEKIADGAVFISTGNDRFLEAARSRLENRLDTVITLPV